MIEKVSLFLRITLVFVKILGVSTCFIPEFRFRCSIQKSIKRPNLNPSFEFYVWSFHAPTRKATSKRKAMRSQCNTVQQNEYNAKTKNPGQKKFQSFWVFIFNKGNSGGVDGGCSNIVVQPIIPLLIFIVNRKMFFFFLSTSLSPKIIAQLQTGNPVVPTLNASICCMHSESCGFLRLIVVLWPKVYNIFHFMPLSMKSQNNWNWMEGKSELKQTP